MLLINLTVVYISVNQVTINNLMYSLGVSIGCVDMF